MSVTRAYLKNNNEMAATMVETALTITIFLMIILGIVDILRVSYMNISAQYALNNALRRINLGEGARKLVENDYPVIKMEAQTAIDIVKAELKDYGITKLDADTGDTDKNVLNQHCATYPPPLTLEFIENLGSVGIMSTAAGSSSWFVAKPGQRAVCNFFCKQESYPSDLVGICFETPMSFFLGVFKTRVHGFAIGRNENW